MIKTEHKIGSIDDVILVPEQWSCRGEIKYHYGSNLRDVGMKQKGRTLWNCSGILANSVKMWTVNAWGETHREEVLIKDFLANWVEYRDNIDQAIKDCADLLAQGDQS